MNKYLEKVAELDKQALNAMKAREMAARVGVIADPRSNWKYALRNLRDGRGNPLEGQALKEGMNRLAGGRDVRREYQQMSAMARKARDIDEVQQVSKAGNPLFPNTILRGQATVHYAQMNSPIHGAGLEEFAAKVQPHVSMNNKAGLSVAHTHPALENTPIIKEVAKQYPDDYMGRLVGGGRIGPAMPSGTTTQQEAFRHLSKSTRRRVYTDDADISKMMKEVPAINAGDSAAYERYLDHVSNYEAQSAKMQGILGNARKGPAQGDSMLFASAYQGKVNPIYAPGRDIVGLHKSTQDVATGVPVSHRSIYFDLSPRATRK